MICFAPRGANWAKPHRPGISRTPSTRALDHETFQISPFVGPELEAELVGLCSNVRRVRWHPDFTDPDSGRWRQAARHPAVHGALRHHARADPVFGDGGNDTDMLAYAGIGVAMGNATAEPKAAADYITDDVDHDGVRKCPAAFQGATRLKHHNSSLCSAPP